MAQIHLVGEAQSGRASTLDLQRSSLFLDLDGTLAPIMPQPDQVGPSDRRTALLRALSRRLGGRLAVVSGRAIEDIDRILEGAVTAVAGVHGLQRRSADGALTPCQAHPAMAAVTEALRALAQRYPGVLIEDKGLSVAAHFRATPDYAGAIDEQARRIADRHGLTVQAGASVIELRTPGPDKGDAIAAFMAEAPFSSGSPVFVGDDLTDEPGFAAVARMGGYGLLVGPERATQATGRLADPAAVLDWLDQAVLADANL